MAEQGVRLVHGLANLTPPRRIVWCGGPMEIAEQLAAARDPESIGTGVKDALVDRVRWLAGRPPLTPWDDVLRAAEQLDANERAGAAAIEEAVNGAADAILCGLRVTARRALLRLRRLGRIIPQRFDEVAIGPAQLASLAVDEYLRDSSPPLGFWKIAASAGWLVPYEQVCWISERPDIVGVDAHGRLHNAEGVALRYRDGWFV
jgi:hypothetical protein